VSDLSALAGPAPRAVAVWQEVEYEDPETCLCSNPQRTRAEFHAIVVSVGPSITAEGDPFLVYRWEAGDPIGPPVTEPRVVVASDRPGRFTVAWSDGALRYLHVDREPADAGEPTPRSPAGSLSSHPNPFRRTTTIAWSLPRSGPARLTIADVRGRVVARLLDGREIPATGHVSWDPRDGDGRPLPPGIYFARLEASDVVRNTKIVLSP
jgi:hypothetical protein